MTVLNRVQLIGHIGQEPKLTEKEGRTFATISLATNESYKKGEQWEKMTEWHNLVIFGKLTSLVSRLQKGSLIFCEGKLRTNHWTDNEGVKRQSTSIIVHNIQLMDNLKPKLSAEQENEDVSLEYSEPNLFLDGGDIPF